MFTMFKLVDAYFGLRLGAEPSIAPQDHVIVVESSRRLAPELSYGYVHALWGLRLADGRSIISAPSGAGEAVYNCAPANAPSIATAKSAGFVSYAQSMVLAAPS
jgi:hypothetical protein